MHVHVRHTHARVLERVATKYVDQRVTDTSSTRSSNVVERVEGEAIGHAGDR